MIRTYISLCTLYFLFISLAFAQEGSIKGKIQLKGAQEPIADIYIFLDKTDFWALSDLKGTFQFENIPAGNYTLMTSGIGFRPIKQKVVIKEGEQTSLVLALEEAIMDLPDVVVSSISLTGGLRGLKEVPGSAFYISPKEIEKFSYTDINRTLRAVPGINLQEEDGFGLRPNIGLRGTGVERSSKITIMEDGVLAAPAPYAAPAAYYFPTIGRMQAVEILKGSSQIRFGPYTTGGAINLLSTTIPSEFSGRVHLLAGSFGSRNLHAYAGNAHKNVAYLVETFQYAADGFKKLDGGQDTGFDKKDYMAKVRVNSNPNAKIYQSLTFKIGQSREESKETYLGLTEADFAKDPYRRYAASQMDEMQTEQEQYSLRHTISLPNNIDITTTAYRNNFHRNWYKLDKVKNSFDETVSISNLLEAPEEYQESYQVLTGTTSQNSDALSVKANNRSYLAKGVQTVISLRLDTGHIAHNLDLGLRYHYDEIDRFQWVDDYQMIDENMLLTNAGIPGTESNRIEKATAFAAYLQYKVKLGKLRILPGLRYENIALDRTDYGKSDPERIGLDISERSNKVDVWIPGVGLDFQFSKDINIFAGVHKGFSPPSTTKGSLPENSINYELGLRYADGPLSGQAVLFFNDYNNLLGADLAAGGGSGSSELFNGGEVESKGLEFQMTYHLLANKIKNWQLPLSLVYTYTDARFQNSFDSNFEGWGKVESGDELPYLANHTFSAVLGLTHKKVSVNLSARYQGEMRTTAGQGPISDKEVIEDQFVIDANVNYLLHRHVTLFGSVTNLTDEAYFVARRPAGLRPGMPRAFQGGLKVNF